MDEKTRAYLWGYVTGMVIVLLYSVSKASDDGEA